MVTIIDRASMAVINTFGFLRFFKSPCHAMRGPYTTLAYFRRISHEHPPLFQLLCFVGLVRLVANWLQRVQQGIEEHRY
jgi:hypothetical protein